MPKIKLKPNSPEYADERKPRIKHHNCEMPGCSAQADHKAPKHRGLNEYYHFCLDHIREYNKAWNFFDGMNDGEVQDHIQSSYYGYRPTWKYGVNGNPEDMLHTAAWQEYNFTDKEPPKDKQYKNHFSEEQRNTPEYEAMAIMGLEPPLTMEEMKKRYKELAKKYHPDLNKGCQKSEELLKRINMAYTILKMRLSEFENLHY